MPIVASEVVGLIPEDALYDAAEFYLKLSEFDRAAILERKLRSAASTGSASLAAMPVLGVRREDGGEDPDPGGGSVAACAAAIGAALGEMVVQVLEEAGHPRSRARPGARRVREGAGPVPRAHRRRRGSRTQAVRRTLQGTQGSADDSSRAGHATAARFATPPRSRSRPPGLDGADRAPRGDPRNGQGDHHERPHERARPLESGSVDGAAANVRSNFEDLKAEGIDTGALTAELKRLGDAGH